MPCYSPLSRKKLQKTQLQTRNHVNPIYNIKEVDEIFEPLQKVLNLVKKVNNSSVESTSCEICWDQSCRNEVQLKRISLVNGSKVIENISIPTNGTLNMSQDDLYDLFDGLEFK
ncbi:Hypothetical_protein [Hexamita inflata]|uniref:Hypothetical_protein n=1 Tax=Hexamita inflata TaxID=28002 RepID=A0AA86PT44_9EUKA|nr:Hypothetical protein HINF_LOCUS32083 [Hexamita inflata]